MGHELISLLYPSLCRSCSCFIKKRQVFCNTCLSHVNNIPISLLPLTPSVSIKVYAIADYQEPLRSLILRKKCADRLAGRQLGQLMGEMKIVCGNDFDYLIPVPLHWTRYIRRGFNQAYEMACVLSCSIDVPVVDLVKRIKRTKYQSNLSQDLRQENVDKVFAVRRRYRDIYKSIVRDKDVLLVDDLCTTGATLKNVAHVLLAGKPKSISAVVACRVV